MTKITRACGKAVATTFADINTLEEAQLARCVALQRHPALIRSTTLFPWWPKQLKGRRGPRWE
jgi:hypothetical protein